MDTINKTVNVYKIMPVTKNDVLTVLNLLKNNYFHDEPLNASTMLIEEKASVIQLENYCKYYLDKGISLMAVSEYGVVVGAIINNIMRRNDVNNSNNENCKESLKFNNITTFLDKVEREVDIFGQYPNVDYIMDMKIITVDKAYRGHGVCKALVGKTKELALESGCQMMFMECSSYFTAKTAEGFGFKRVYLLPFLNYVNEQGEIVFKTQPPHTNFRIYVLALKQSKNNLFTMREISKKDLSYTIKLITANNIPTVLSTFTDEFLCDEPLNGSIGLIKEKESVAEHVEFCINYLQKGISVMAISQNGEVMGGIINNIMTRTDVQYDGNFNQYSELNAKVVTFLYKTKIQSNVFSQYPHVDQILDMNIIAVNRNYRGYGICKSLVNKSKELALELGCQMIYAECSSYYSAKAVENFGLKCIYSVTYTDYIDENGEVVFKTQPPHECFKVYALLL